MDDKWMDLKAEIIERIPEGWDSVTEILYRHYTSAETDSSEPVREAYKVLKDHTSGLPFAERNQILCAATAMCVEYERAAFQDGIAIGAKLILGLLEAEA